MRKQELSNFGDATQRKKKKNTTKENACFVQSVLLTFCWLN